MTGSITNTPAPSLPQYCVLVYVGLEPAAKLLGDEAPVVVALFERQSVSILVNPMWKAILPETEWAYFEELLLDWKEQVAARPWGLFQQLCSLSVGPLITARDGSDPASDPLLRLLIDGFQAV